MLAQVGQARCIVGNLLLDPTLLAVTIFLHAIHLHDTRNIEIAGVEQKAHHRTAVVNLAIGCHNHTRPLHLLSEATNRGREQCDP